MDGIIKRRSLTLSTRLLQKRHSASPQSCGRPGSGSAQDVSCSSETPGSPSSAVSITDDVESTPPHKRQPSLDDSVDFSPRLDVSLSPHCLFSQTLAIESPEVGWRWNRSSNATTDSGFDSAELSVRDRRRQITFKGCEDRRSQLDNNQWRAQQMRARDLLKERCDKLHRQLDQVAVSEKVPEPMETPRVSVPVAARTRSASKRPSPESQPPEPALPVADPMVDFLNDSESDMFLLEASQQLESKLEEQKPPKPAGTTPTSHHKAKRPSFYMKFLEDESESEDWLSALEEAVQQATMPPKKPRNSLQRYKSMPTTGDASSGISTLTNVMAGNGPATCTSASSASGSALADTPRMKRHASSHALSPATSHARGKLFGSRK
ncbi:uncharacterized protein LOC110186578 [Drosophila serrata]|uniref:uncharacterized protein LOC110186578 n=1 Tax=Drosophila serrata TaxID=7274 RepID=UPI000A1D160D|nr:uncharacterized protein LOC110186578 [Drosophila serrata]